MVNPSDPSNLSRDFEPKIAIIDIRKTIFDVWGDGSDCSSCKNRPSNRRGKGGKKGGREGKERGKEGFPSPLFPPFCSPFFLHFSPSSRLLPAFVPPLFLPPPFFHPISPSVFLSFLPLLLPLFLLLFPLLSPPLEEQEEKEEEEEEEEEVGWTQKITNRLREVNPSSPSNLPKTANIDFPKSTFTIFGVRNGSARIAL